VRRLRGLAVDEAVELFDHLLAAEGVDAAIPLARKRDIAKYLGGYPRALSLFANRLRYEPLDDLLGLAHEAWEGKDRQVSPELLAGIETEMFDLLRQPSAQLALAGREGVLGDGVEAELVQRGRDLAAGAAELGGDGGDEDARAGHGSISTEVLRWL
jgi:hypothetical protein